jgi:hypothetical protein
MAAESSNEPQTLVGTATPWEEAVERRLAEMVSAIRTSSDRMALLERTLQSLSSQRENLAGKGNSSSPLREPIAPLQADSHLQADLQRLLASVARLESAVASWGGSTQDQLADLQSPSKSASPNLKPSQESQKPQEARTEWMSRATGALSQLLRGSAADGQATSGDVTLDSNNAPLHKPVALESVPSSSGRNPPRSEGRASKSGKRQQERNASNAKGAKAEGGNGPATNKSVHDRRTDRQGHPTTSSRGGLTPASGSRPVSGAAPATTHVRVSDEATADGPDLSMVDELIADPTDPTLAASGSREETLVLGSLVRLRQEKANTFSRRLKWSLIGFGLFLAIAIPIAWKSIPEGWRNLIWVSMNPWDSGDAGSP